VAYAWEAQLSASERNRVIWAGQQIPGQLISVANALGLSVERTTDVVGIKPESQDLFAVIVSGEGAEAAKAEGRLLTLLIKRLPDYGVFIAIASSNLEEAGELQNRVLNKTKFSITKLGLSLDYFARALRSHNAGWQVSPALAFPLPGHTEVDYGEDHKDDYESDEILLRRAFNGFASLDLKPQPGGRSKDCKVWKVTATRNGDACEPFVAKAARLEDLNFEFETYRTFVRDFVPFPFRAPVLESRFVKGATRAVLVSAFVGRSLRLDDYLATASNPELVMVSLFEGALGKWRRAATLTQGSLGRLYVDLQREAEAKKSSAPDTLAKSLLPDPARLQTAFEDARAKDASLFSPSQLWSILQQFPEKDYFTCQVHGDLNVRNVFVRWNSIDTILIDFSHSGTKASLARDPSKLETSIALNVVDRGGRPLSESDLRQLYRSPLLPPRGFLAIDGRTDAVYQIRRLAGGEGIPRDEYELLTGCHLLRFACEPEVQTGDALEMRSRRALSYTLACGLIRNLGEQAHT
jgi:hypothetical protein